MLGSPLPREGVLRVLLRVLPFLATWRLAGLPHSRMSWSLGVLLRGLLEDPLLEERQSLLRGGGAASSSIAIRLGLYNWCAFLWALRTYD